MNLRPGTQLSARGRLSGERFYLPSEPRGELVSRSPANPTDLIGVFPYGREDVHEAVVAASRAARPWSQQSVSERLDAVQAIRPELVRVSPDLAACMVRETGRPSWECQREIQGLLSRLDQMNTDAQAALSDRTYGDLPGRVSSVPLGVVAITGPAMLPVATAHTHIIAALCAGNTVVWKPSPHCPGTAQLYAEILHMAGLPPGVFNMIQGDDEVGFELCTHADVDAVVFTGTTAHGQLLKRALVDRYDLRLHLHLSGKNAAVVFEDADLDTAAYEVMVSAMQSAGQRCTSTSRVLVHQSILGEFLGKLIPLCTSLRVGPPGKDVFMGPLLSEARRERFLAALAGVRDQGAEPLLGSERLELPGYFVSPSLHLIRKRMPEAPYQRDEHLGPDLAIYPIHDMDDALQLTDRTPFGLCASVFTRSPLRWRRFCEEVRVGSLFWNRGTLAPSGRMPFGGIKQSGYGGRGGADAIHALRREVSLLGRTSDATEILPGTEAPSAASSSAGSNSTAPSSTEVPI